MERQITSRKGTKHQLRADFRCLVRIPDRPEPEDVRDDVYVKEDELAAPFLCGRKQDLKAAGVSFDQGLHDPFAHLAPRVM